LYVCSPRRDSKLAGAMRMCRYRAASLSISTRASLTSAIVRLRLLRDVSHVTAVVAAIAAAVRRRHHHLPTPKSTRLSTPVCATVFRDGFPKFPDQTPEISGRSRVCSFPVLPFGYRGNVSHAPHQFTRFEGSRFNERLKSSSHYHH